MILLSGEKENIMNRQGLSVDVSYSVFKIL